MRAVVIDEGQLRWQERPDPEPGDHEVVVAVRAAGVNGADLSQRGGTYPAPPGWPQDIPGLEMAGEVAAVGARVTRFASGDRVMALVGGGAQAELAVVDETHALPVPAGLSWPEAGGFMEAYATAYDALFGQAGLTLGDRVLVTGAAGGVGTAAVQLAAARRRARRRVRARPRAARGRGRAGRDRGRRTRRRWPAHGPYDVVLELVGAASLPSALAVTRHRRARRRHRHRQRRRRRGRPQRADACPRPDLRLDAARAAERREGRPRRDARRAGRAGARRGPPARACGGHVRPGRRHRRLRALRRRRQGRQDRPHGLA